MKPLLKDIMGHLKQDASDFKKEAREDKKLIKKIRKSMPKKSKKMVRAGKKAARSLKQEIKEGKKADKIGIVMKEFKQGKLRSGSKKGPKVTKPKQAIAIALSEARRMNKKRK